MSTKNPEDSPTGQEVEQARRLGEALDKLLAGQAPSHEDDLVATSRMIRSTIAEDQLAAERRDALVRKAMRQVLVRPAPRRLRWASSLAVVAAGVALVAVSLLMVQSGGRPPSPVGPPTQMLSRSSDDLMGRPFADRAGASQRLDLVFADRLAGYRQVTLTAGAGP